MDEKLSEACKLLRYDILTATTTAGSGHPTSSLSAVELMATLFFGGFFHTNLDDPHDPSNDKLIFSKGHAAPLLYALYHAAGVIGYEELMTIRTFDSRLEGHPTPNFPYVDFATGSLGQGLSIAVGMSLGLNLKIKNLKLKIARTPKVFVLLGDSELAEGQNWEAMQLASHYKLENIVAILDMNRLGQRGETMLGWDAIVYANRAKAFGWEPLIIKDGHDIEEIKNAFESVQSVHALTVPKFIIAHTVKGKGVSFLENKDGWHGKSMPKDMLDTALKEIGNVDTKLRMDVKSWSEIQKKSDKPDSGHADKKAEVLSKLESYFSP